MLWLKENTYFVQAGSGSFLLSYEALLRLDETVTRDVVDSVMPALTQGQSFHEASAQLPAEQQAPARDLLSILQDHGLMVATMAARSSYPAPRPEGHLSDQLLVVTGDGALSTDFAAALKQTGLNVRLIEPAKADAAIGTATSLAVEMLAVAEGDNAPLCHVAAHDDGVCWSFADVREQTQVAPLLAASRRAASFRATTASSDGLGTQIPYKTLMAIAAKQIAHRILRSSPAQPPAGVVTFLDRRTLRISTHNVAVHPYDVPAKQRTQDEFRRDAKELHNGPLLGRPELTERWQRLSDERFGAFEDLDDTNFRQLPLKVTLARLSDPCRLLSAPPAVVGVGIDRESARERAIVQALAAYGSIMVDPRLLVDKNGTFLGPREGDAARLLGPVRDGSVDAFVRAIDLTDGRERLLPARQAFPVLRMLGPAHTPCGTSAALEWRQALTHGLLQHCVRLTVSDSSFPARQHSALAAEDFDQDSGVRFLAAMVKAAGIDLTLHDITGPAGIPVVACTSTSEKTVYGGGVHIVEAVREALTAALFRFQLRCDPVLREAMSTATRAIWTNPASSASLSPDRLVHALTSLGYTPSVMALDHDRTVHETFPYILRVVLATEQRSSAARSRASCRSSSRPTAPPAPADNMLSHSKNTFSGGGQ